MLEEAVVEVDKVNNDVLWWVPIAKSFPAIDSDKLDYKDIGVVGVKFNTQDFNPLDYFILMFPGDWHLKLHQLNVRIDKEQIHKQQENKQRKVQERGDYMEWCTEDEFFRFIGIIIAASLHQNGGRPLWMTKGTETCAAPNFGEFWHGHKIVYGFLTKISGWFMKEERFIDLRREFSWVMVSPN